MNRWLAGEIRKPDNHKKRGPTSLESRELRASGPFARLAGLEKADSIHAGKGAGSVTHGQGCDTFLEDEVAGSTGIEAQAHVPHGPAT